MTAQTEDRPQSPAAAAKNWLANQFQELRDGIAALEKRADALERTNYSLHYKVGKVESELEAAKRENDDLRKELANADRQLSETYQQVKEAVAADYREDLGLLAQRLDLSTSCLSHLAEVLVCSLGRHSGITGSDALGMLGASAEAVITVRTLAVPAPPARSIPFSDNGSGLRYTSEPSAAHQYSSAASQGNRLTYSTPLTGEERELREIRAEAEVRALEADRLAPSWVVDRSL